jgi:hypothetical protein
MKRNKDGEWRVPLKHGQRQTWEKLRLLRDVIAENSKKESEMFGHNKKKKKKKKKGY